LRNLLLIVVWHMQKCSLNTCTARGLSNKFPTRRHIEGWIIRVGFRVDVTGWYKMRKCETAKVSKYKMQKCMRKCFRNLFTTQVPTACYKSVVLRLSVKLQNLFLIKRSCCCCVVVLPYKIPANTHMHSHDEDMFSRFDVIHEHDGRTDGHCMTAKTALA